MRSLSTAHTVYYNLRRKRHGHLFDGRFKAKMLNVSCGTTVSKQVIRRRKLIAEDSELRSQVERREKRLNELRVTEQLLNA